MIYKQRTYTLKMGTAPEYLKRWETDCLPIIGKYARLAGCWQTESGRLNAIVFLWAYDSFGHREQQRAKLKADTEWKKASAWVKDYIVTQDNIFLSPAPFSP